MWFDDRRLHTHTHVTTHARKISNRRTLFLFLFLLFIGRSKLYLCKHHLTPLVVNKEQTTKKKFTINRVRPPPPPAGGVGLS